MTDQPTEAEQALAYIEERCKIRSDVGPIYFDIIRKALKQQPKLFDPAQDEKEHLERVRKTVGE